MLQLKSRDGQNEIFYKRYNYTVFTRNVYKYKDSDILKMRECKKKSCSRINYKKANVTILIWHKVDFKTSSIAIGRGHFIMIKWSINKKHIRMLNVYMPNNRTPKYMEQKLARLKRE